MPVKAGIPITDLGAALFALVGILVALEYRHKTGDGQHVDTSLVDAGVGLSVWEAAQYFSGRGVPERLGSAHRMSAPYQAFRCSDGYITIGGANDRSFRRICEVVGHNEWVDEPRFRTDADRTRHRDELAALIDAITRTQTRAHWLARLDAAGVPCGPINDYAQVFEDPQVIAREMVVDVEHPTLGRIKTLGSPIKMSATPPDVIRRAPLLGEHTREILREIGLTNGEGE
jgi:formyl-CoA transferase